MSTPAPAHYLRLELPARQQWEGNHGYCGEICLISAGLYYGQYASQYTVRALASPEVAQTAEESQLLLGVNDAYAAAALRLGYLTWDSEAGKSVQDFLVWIKQCVARGYPVAIGVYMNERICSGELAPTAGDPDYDHIVPVLGIGSHQPFARGDYLADDTLIFSDNGLWCPDGTRPAYRFEVPFAAFPASRRAANAGSAIYSLNSSINYGIAFTGVADRAGDTVAVRVQTDRLAEPPIVDGTGARPRPVPLQLTVTLAGLQPGVEYRLYRYDSFAAVPDSGFNAAAAAAVRTWTVKLAAGSTYVLRDSCESCDTAIYRAVRAAAP